MTAGEGPHAFDRRTALKGAAGAALGGVAVVAGTDPAGAATATKLEAYADRTSVAPGGTIAFFVHNGLSRNTASTATFRIVRIAHPSDVQVNSASVTVKGQTTPANAWSNGCNWTGTTSFKIPTTWPSGLYNATFTAGALHTVVPFVVTPRTPGSAGRIALQVPFTTAQAYNDWGGKSLYEFRSSNGVRSYKVSMDRPFTDPEFGDFYQWVYPFIRYAGRKGIALDYWSSVDLHTTPALLDPYQLFVTVGHDEYWSYAMRQTLDRFVLGGGNAAVLSGNTCYWQIRFDPSPQGAANRVITCYKDWNADPIADQKLKTVEWEEFGPVYKHALGAYSEHTSIGLGFDDGAIWSSSLPRPSTPYVLHRPEHWLLAGTGLAQNAAFGGDIVGYETDSLDWSIVGGRPVPTGVDGAPSNFSIVAIADTTGWGDVQGDGTAQTPGHAVMGAFRNNGTVVNVGTVDWTKGLTGSGPVELITDNLVAKLGAAKSARDRNTAELYQYHAENADGSWRFVFTASPFFTQPNTGWTYDGQAFWIHPKAQTGAVPVYQFHFVDPDGRWSFSYNVSQAPLPGWTRDGIAFYAYANARVDAEPVYQYHAPTEGAIDRVLYTRDPALGLGWTLDHLSFHAPLKPVSLSET